MTQPADQQNQIKNFFLLFLDLKHSHCTKRILLRVESSIGSGSAVTKRKVPYIEFVKSGVVPYSFNREMTTSFPQVDPKVLLFLKQCDLTPPLKGVLL